MIDQINYVIGDATEPKADGNKVIAHICNDIGAWGAGFVMALSAKWKEPEERYLETYNLNYISLGKVQLVKVTNNTRVANLVAQESIGFKNGREPIRYDALVVCLRKLTTALLSSKDSFSVHMPRIGCGLGGGRWEIVAPIVNIELCERGIPVTVYDFKG